MMTCAILVAAVQSNPGLHDLLVAIYGNLARAVLQSCGF